MHNIIDVNKDAAFQVDFKANILIVKINELVFAVVQMADSKLNSKKR